MGVAELPVCVFTGVCVCTWLDDSVVGDIKRDELLFRGNSCVPVHLHLLLGFLSGCKEKEKNQSGSGSARLTPSASDMCFHLAPSQPGPSSHSELPLAPSAPRNLAAKALKSLTNSAADWRVERV